MPYATRWGHRSWRNIGRGGKADVQMMLEQLPTKKHKLWTYPNPVRELDSTNLDRLEELWDRLAIGLRDYRCPCSRELCRGEVGNIRCGGVEEFLRHLGRSAATWRRVQEPLYQNILGGKNRSRKGMSGKKCRMLEFSLFCQRERWVGEIPRRKHF